MKAIKPQMGRRPKNPKNGERTRHRVGCFGATRTIFSRSKPFYVRPKPKTLGRIDPQSWLAHILRGGKIT